MPRDNDFTLELTLRQHTPLIHFQADQPGATLRATELKPKLDRFLLKKNSKLPARKHPNGHQSLDYKIFIEPLEEIEVFPLEYPLMNNKTQEMKRDRHGNTVNGTLSTFFANMGPEWKKKPKKLVFCPNTKVTISSLDTELIRIIRENISEFFMTHNFGMRQSKGFGSFTVEKIGTETVEQNWNGLDYCFQVDNLNQIQTPNTYYKHKAPGTRFKTMEKLFYAIHRFHQTLRSGINENGIYVKPWIFFYAKDKGIQWDKKTFKQKFLGNSCVKEQKEHHNATKDSPIGYQSDQDNYLVRDLLGLSTNQLWRKPFEAPYMSKDCINKYGFTLRHPKKKKNSSNTSKSADKYPGSHPKKGNIPLNKIKRFASPFIYKPVLKNGVWYVGIATKKIPPELFKHNFILIKESSRNVADMIEDMQMYPKFTASDFFKFVYDKRQQIANHIKAKKDNQKHLLIQSMYQSLQKVHP
ncbi:hypothetical protein [Hydrogenimonas sp.]